MRYFKIFVLLSVFISNQVFGDQNVATDGKTKLELDFLNKAYSVCDVIWSEEKENRHPLSQEIRALVNNPTSVNICERIRQSACSKNYDLLSNHV